MRTRCHDGRVSCSLQDEALDTGCVDARADEAAVKARRIMGVCLLRFVGQFGWRRYVVYLLVVVLPSGNIDGE